MRTYKTRILIFFNPQLFFFPVSKISTSTRMGIQIEFVRPPESGFTLVPRAPMGKLATDHASWSPS